jgi:hypothetical protein
MKTEKELSMEKEYENIVKNLEKNNWKRIVVNEKTIGHDYSDAFYAKKGYQVRIMLNMSFLKITMTIYSRWKDMTVYYGECPTLSDFNHIFSLVDFD